MGSLNNQLCNLEKEKKKESLIKGNVTVGGSTYLEVCSSSDYPCQAVCNVHRISSKGRTNVPAQFFLKEP